MRIWTLELILEQIKTFGTIETEWMHSEYKKKMNFGGPGAECYGLNSVSPKFICWNPNTWCDSIWRWALWEIFNFRCHKGRALMMRLVSCLKKKKVGGHTRTLSPCHVGTQWEGALYKTERVLSPELTPAGTVISELQPPETWENTFLLFKMPSLWYFAMAGEKIPMYN